MLEKLKEKFVFLKWFDPFTYVDLYLMPVVNPHKNKSIEWVVYIVTAFIFAFAIYTILGFALNTPSPMVIVVSGSMEPVFYRGDVVVLQGKTAEEMNAHEVEISEAIGNVHVSNYLETFCSGSLSNQIGNMPLTCIDYLKLAPESGVHPGTFRVTNIKLAGQTIPVTTQGDVIVYYSGLLREPIIHRAVAKIKAPDGTFFITKGDSPNNPLIDQELGIAHAAISYKEIQGVALFKIPFIGYAKLLVFDDLHNLIFGCKRAGGCPFP